MEDTYWGKLKTLTVLQEDESLLNDFDSIFIVNPDENKAAEKPVEEKKKKKSKKTKKSGKGKKGKDSSDESSSD